MYKQEVRLLVLISLTSFCNWSIYSQFKNKFNYNRYQIKKLQS